MVSHVLYVAAVFGMTGPLPNDLVAKAKIAARELEAEAADIQGYYTCKGQEAGGKTYSGVAVISRKGDVYVVQWMVGTGSTFTGIGIRQGNTFAASWAIPSDKGVVKGVNLYRIETTSSGPRLVGRWASIPGPGLMQSESLLFLKQIEVEE